MTGAQRFEMTGGRLCLDFANTVDNRPASNRRDFITSYADLIAWSRQARVLTDRGSAALLTAAARRPKQASKALLEAHRLREVIYRIFSAIAAGSRAGAGDFDALNSRVPALLARSRLVPCGPGYAWAYDGSESRLDRMLWAVSRSAVDLLLDEDLPQLRECAAANCGWLFMDRSKSHRRRWCDMKVCGNRAKIRRFRARDARTRAHSPARRTVQSAENGG